MFKEEDKTEWIDRYLDNLLSEADKTEFEALLQKDTELQLDVEAQKAARKTIELETEKKLKDTFKRIHARMQPEEKGFVPELSIKPEENAHRFTWWSKKNILAIAACVLVVIAASSIWWLNRGNLFDTGRQEIITGNVFQVPIFVKGGMGYAGTKKLLDSITVQIVYDKQYVNHYKFKDTLQIFSQTLSEKSNVWEVEYNDSLNTHTLIINNQRYPLERGFNRMNKLIPE